MMADYLIQNNEVLGCPVLGSMMHLAEELPKSHEAFEVGLPGSLSDLGYATASAAAFACIPLLYAILLSALFASCQGLC